MGTKVYSESHFSGYYPMQNFSEDSNGGSLPLFYGDKTLANGQYHNRFLSRAGGSGGYLGYEKDIVKQKMLEHEAIFKSQVYELHRLYKVQRDIIEDVKRKDLHTYHIPAEGSASSSPLGFQRPAKEVQKWHKPMIPLSNSSGARPLLSNAETSRSHLSSIENKSLQGGPGECQNGDKSVDCEILGSRPTKVRRKMFDLRLPADAYIDKDEVEHCGNKRVADSGNAKLFKENIRSGVGLADLNEPFEVEEANTFVSRDSLGYGPSNFLPNGTSQNLDDEKQTYQHNKGTGREWMSNMLEEGHLKNNRRSDSRDFQSETLPHDFQPLQGMFYKPQNLQSNPRTDRNKDDFWRDRTMPTSRFPERNDTAQANQFTCSYEPLKSWPQSFTSREKPFSNHNQQLMLFEPHPCFSMSANLSSYQSSAPSPASFGEKLHTNGYTQSNSLYRSDVPDRNRIYPGSPSGSKSLCTSTAFGRSSIYKDSKVVDENVKHTSTQYFNGSSNYIDLNSTNHIKVDLMSSRSSKPLSEDIKPETPRGKSFIQILTSTPCSDNVRSNGIDTGECTTPKILGVPIFAKKVKKFDEDNDGLFDINCPYEPSDAELRNDEITNSMEKPLGKEVAGVNYLIDLNLCISEDEDLLSPSRTCGEVKKVIEINLEAPLPPESESSEEDILYVEASQDLLLHTTTFQTSNQDDRDTLAAEAIVAISSSLCEYPKISRNNICNPSLDTFTDPLRWFVDVISSCVDDHATGKHGDKKKETPSKGFDYFEEMTLKLTEVNVDEYYFSEFLTTKNPKVEETGAILTNRRKGQARRGRPKRDFQRDVLPGIASLSRHDVREDLHTFEGLVKATGCSWHSCLTRTTAKTGRGRRRNASAAAAAGAVATNPICSPPVIPKVNIIIEAGLEDRSLTGWGKTTRRPRRQRGPVGNPPRPSAPLT